MVVGVSVLIQLTKAKDEADEEDVSNSLAHRVIVKDETREEHGSVESGTLLQVVHEVGDLTQGKHGELESVESDAPVDS